MQALLRRLSIVAMICFFPLAIIGIMKEKATPRTAILYYYISILIFLGFLFCLAFYTYSQGGNFIKPMGTFY